MDEYMNVYCVGWMYNLNGLSTTTHRHRDVVPPSITNNAPELKTIGISAYSPPSINVTLTNVNSLYLLTKSYSPHIVN
jgi:hypothetical protein